MKNFIGIVFILCLCTMDVIAQNNITIQEIPSAIAYDGVAYGSNDEPLVNQSISLRASILIGNTTGTVEWQETHNLTTNDDGSFSIVIGEGIRTGGNQLVFDEIPWGSSSFYLRMEMDATGGNNFGSAATERFCSVPYSFRSSVSDSLSGVNKEAILQLLIPTCYCSMQGSYDNGSTIVINNSTIQNGVSVTNNSTFAGTNFFSAAGGTNNSNPGFFSIKNSSNTNTSLGARTNGLGNALQVYSPNANNSKAAIIAIHSGLSSALEATTIHSTNTQPTISAITSGVGYAGYFGVKNSNSTLAALKSEVLQGPNSVNVGAGEFLIAEPTNTAPIIDAQSNGLGGGGLFHLNNPNNGSTGVEIIQKGTPSSLALLVETSNNGGLFGAALLSTIGTQHSGYTVGIGHKGIGYPLIVNKTYNSGAASGGGMPAIYVFNASYGPGIQINHTNTATNSGSPGLYVYEQGMGKTAQFIGAGSPQNINNVVEISSQSVGGRMLNVKNNNLYNTSNVVEINSAGTGTLLRAFTANTLGIGKYVGHFTTNNTTGSNPTVWVESNNQGSPLYALNTGSGQGSTFLSMGNNPNVYSLNAFGLTGNGISAYSSKTSLSTYTDGTSSNALYAATPLNNFQTAYAGYFYGRVNIEGDFTVVGSKNAVVKNAAGTKVTMYCEESSEVWFTDYGFGQLNNGEVTISIPQDFLELVNTSLPYHIYIQPEGDSKGLFVELKSASSFTIKEAQQGDSDIQFSYRIVAKRKYYDNLRLASPSVNAQTTVNYMNSQWSNEVTEGTNKQNQIMQNVANLVDPNYIISTPTVDPIDVLPAPDPSTLLESPSNVNPSRLQPTNPTIQDVNTILDPE